MRVAILSDIHANGYALDAVRKHAKNQQVDTYWFLGDSVGYGPHPIEALQFLQTLDPASWVPGNHDAGLVGELSEYSFNEHAQEALRLNRQCLIRDRPDLLEWLATHVKAMDQWVKRKPLGSDVFVLVHGALCRQDGHPESISCCTPSRGCGNRVLKDLNCLATLAGTDARRAVLLSGHTHVPNFSFLDGSSDGETGVIYPGITWGEPMVLPFSPTIINPGSVGQPRDADERASYVILDTEPGVVTFYRVEYPIREERVAT